MPKPRAEVGIPPEKPLSKEELDIVKFLENNYKIAYTAEDIKKEFPEITSFSISYLLQSLTNNKIIDAKPDKYLRGYKTLYYMAKEKGAFDRVAKK